MWYDICISLPTKRPYAITNEDLCKTLKEKIRSNRNLLIIKYCVGVQEEFCRDIQ